MKLLGHLYLLAALGSAGVSQTRSTAAGRSAPDDALSERLPSEEIAAAWRRWAQKSDRPAARVTRGRGLAIPPPEPAI